MTEIAIVILNWNTRDLLDKYLPVMIGHSLDAGTEIWLADNASSDGSIALVQQKYPSVKTLTLDKNYGFAGGYNRALAQITAKYYLLVNTDVEVTAEWLRPLHDLMESQPGVAACMPKIRSLHEREKFEYAGAAGGFIDYLGYPFCRGRIFDVTEADAGQYDDEMNIFWATGACMLVRTEVFKQLKGFDEVLFAHMEEIDLCWRMQRQGYTLKYCPGSVVYHIGGGTLPKKNPWKTFLNFRNNLILLYKNLPPRRLWTILFIRLVLDGISGIRFLAKGDFGDLGAIFRAHFAFYRLIPQYTKYRKQQNWKNQPELQGFYRKSIVWQFFVLTKRTFTGLSGW